MEWQDKGLLLSTKRLGETKLLATFLTQAHGKQSGLFATPSTPHFFTPLAHIMQLEWRGRGSDQLGFMKAEPATTFKPKSPLYTSYILKNALLSLLQNFLLPHDSHPLLFTKTVTFLTYNTQRTNELLRQYFTWENTLLTELGYFSTKVDLEAPLEDVANQMETALSIMADELGKSIPIGRSGLMGAIHAHARMTA